MSPKTIPSAPRDSAAIPAWCAGSRGRPLTTSASGPDGLRLAGEERGADRAAEVAELGEQHRRRPVVGEDVREHGVLEPLAVGGAGGVGGGGGGGARRARAGGGGRGGGGVPGRGRRGRGAPRPGGGGAAPP